MEIKVKQLDLEGMYGWNVKGADIGLVIDEITGSYSVKVSGSKLNYRWVTEEEMDFLLRLFEIK
ncbi:hypothetical protein [Nosocomiicoccus ampullae]|uniref:hypothetical protein n=1 Tax=Nosocomiicoccus ampullae TaxID=489910 RepID=UPI001C5F9E88|nr:hypothetical protein [Nosocomiicoccus ampullae]QYA47980.1 hypothetical protein KPF52_05855 [Nosocomiicoccus ampullae]